MIIGTLIVLVVGFYLGLCPVLNVNVMHHDMLTRQHGFSLAALAIFVEVDFEMEIFSCK